MLVSSTSEIISKLQEYESKYGVGAVRSIGTVMAGDRKVNFIFEIANDTLDNEFLGKEDAEFRKERIEISAISDEEIFKDIAKANKKNCAVLTNKIMVYWCKCIAKDAKADFAVNKLIEDYAASCGVYEENFDYDVTLTVNSLTNAQKRELYKMLLKSNILEDF